MTLPQSLRNLLLLLPLLLFAGCERDTPKPEPSSVPKPATAVGRFSKPIVVATEAAYPPMEFMNEKNEIVGFDIDLMREIAKAGGFAIEFKNTPWDAIFPSLKVGDVDAIISSITITEERKQTMRFSDPYYRSGQRLVLRAADAGKNLTLETMAGKSVGVQVGTTGAELLAAQYPEVKTKPYDNVIFGFKDLENGSIDGFVTDDPVARYYARAGSAQNLHFVEKEYTAEEYGIVVRSDDEELVAKINEGLKKVQESGIVDQLKNKWLR